MGGREMEHGVEVGCESSLLSVGVHARVPAGPRGAHGLLTWGWGDVGRQDGKTERAGTWPTHRHPRVLPVLSLSLSHVRVHAHTRTRTHTHISLFPQAHLYPRSHK